MSASSSLLTRFHLYPVLAFRHFCPDLRWMCPPNFRRNRLGLLVVRLFLEASCLPVSVRRPQRHCNSFVVGHVHIASLAIADIIGVGGAPPINFSVRIPSRAGVLVLVLTDDHIASCQLSYPRRRAFVKLIILVTCHAPFLVQAVQFFLYHCFLEYFC